MEASDWGALDDLADDDVVGFVAASPPPRAIAVVDLPRRRGPVDVGPPAPVGGDDANIRGAGNTDDADSSTQAHDFRASRRERKSWR